MNHAIHFLFGKTDGTPAVLKLLSGSIMAITATALGGFDSALKILIALSAADFVTGILCAIVTKTLNSTIGYVGIIRKIFIYIMVGIANAIDIFMYTTPMLRSAMMGFYIAMEALSVLENAGKTGLPLPKFIKRVLIQLQEGDD